MVTTAIPNIVPRDITYACEIPPAAPIHYNRRLDIVTSASASALDHFAQY